MNSSKGKILVVDDELANQKICAVMLDELGYSYDIASNGKEAIDACSTNKYDLVLMDSKMPVMDGMESIRQIRILEQQDTHTPIILVSGNIDKLISNDVKIDGFLQKPFGLEKLKNICDQYLFSQSKSAEDLDTGSNNKRQGNGYRYIDRTALDELCTLSNRNNSDLYVKMINRFVKETPNKINDLRINLENNDLENLAIKAHELGSWCSFLGVVRVVSALRNIENMVYAKDMVNARTVLSELDEEVSIAGSILKDKLLKENIPVDAKIVSLPIS